MPDLSVVLGGARASPAQQKLYLEYLCLGRLDIMASFLPAPWQSVTGGACLHRHLRAAYHLRK